jgi:hypothetical protein
VINDRGTKKWTSLMLPEHLEKLKNVFAEQAYKTKPMLDEQQIMENESILQHAIYDHLTVGIKYFQDHDLHHLQGKITKVIGDDLWIDHLKININNIIEINYM